MGVGEKEKNKQVKQEGNEMEVVEEKAGILLVK